MVFLKDLCCRHVKTWVCLGKGSNAIANLALYYNTSKEKGKMLVTRNFPLPTMYSPLLIVFYLFRDNFEPHFIITPCLCVHLFVCPSICLCVRPSVFVSISVQNTSFCQSAGRGIKSHLVIALVCLTLSQTSPSFYMSAVQSF